MKLGIVVIAALLSSFLGIHQVLSGDYSNGEFSSLLETLVGNPTTPPFRINGPNGYCADTSDWIYTQLNNCEGGNASRTFTFNSDGTIRLVSKGTCLTARGFTQGSLAEMDTCSNPNKNATTWQVSISDQQIKHPASGLVLSAVSGVRLARFTLEYNVFSSYQTFRLDTNTAVLTAHIVGMNGLCLLSSSTNEVWLGSCGTSGSWQKWLIYPDGTIRPQQRSGGCLSYENLSTSTVVITTCGLAPSAERWLFTSTSAILNANTNLVLDVASANPSLKQILVYSPSGGANQKFEVFYE